MIRLLAFALDRFRNAKAAEARSLFLARLRRQSMPRRIVSMTGAGCILIFGEKP